MLAALLTLTGAVGVASAASPVTEGYLLIGTDAAYTRLIAPIDECHGLELFVGYVQADGLKSPIGDGRPRFHSDVEAYLTVFERADVDGCGADVLQLYGVDGISEGDDVGILELESAHLNGYQLTLSGTEGESGVSATVTVDLAWAADGPKYAETSRGAGNHSAHLTVQAAVEGTITIDSVAGGDVLAGILAGLVGQGAFGGFEQVEGSLTHYREIGINVP